jgi:protein-S-isoprenylcysteine O-methyltransferase Ste14
MYGFLLPLLIGFLCNSASAFTGAYSRRWGERGGRLASLLLRNVVGIPVWVLGLVLATRTRSPSLFRSGFAADVLGWLLVGVGSVLILAALLALRSRAAVPSVHDSLVKQGPYAHVRHPIYSGMLLEFGGLVLMVPTQAVALACVLGVGWILIQAKLEELDLLQRLPPYREYMERVPRFIPRLRRRQPV